MTAFRGIERSFAAYQPHIARSLPDYSLSPIAHPPHLITPQPPSVISSSEASSIWGLTEDEQPEDEDDYESDEDGARTPRPGDINRKRPRPTLTYDKLEQAVEASRNWKLSSGYQHIESPQQDKRPRLKADNDLLITPPRPAPRPPRPEPTPAPSQQLGLSQSVPLKPSRPVPPPPKPPPNYPPPPTPTQQLQVDTAHQARLRGSSPVESVPPTSRRVFESVKVPPFVPSRPAPKPPGPPPPVPLPPTPTPAPPPKNEVKIEIAIQPPPPSPPAPKPDKPVNSHTASAGVHQLFHPRGDQNPPPAPTPRPVPLPPTTTKQAVPAHIQQYYIINYQPRLGLVPEDPINTHIHGQLDPFPPQSQPPFHINHTYPSFVSPFHQESSSGRSGLSLPWLQSPHPSPSAVDSKHHTEEDYTPSKASSDYSADHAHSSHSPSAADDCDSEEESVEDEEEEETAWVAAWQATAKARLEALEAAQTARRKEKEERKKAREVEKIRKSLAEMSAKLPDAQAQLRMERSENVRLNRKLNTREKSIDIVKKEALGTHAGRVKFLDSMEEEISCAVCQSVMVDPYQITPCGHIGCGHCVVSWLNTQVSETGNATCPICREEVNREIVIVPARQVSSIISKWIQEKDGLPGGWDGYVDWLQRSEAWSAYTTANPELVDGQHFRRTPRDSRPSRGVQGPRFDAGFVLGEAPLGGMGDFVYLLHQLDHNHRGLLEAFSDPGQARSNGHRNAEHQQDHHTAPVSGAQGHGADDDREWIHQGDQDVGSPREPFISANGAFGAPSNLMTGFRPMMRGMLGNIPLSMDHYTRRPSHPQAQAYHSCRCRR